MSGPERKHAHDLDPAVFLTERSPFADDDDLDGGLHGYHHDVETNINAPTFRSLQVAPPPLSAIVPEPTRSLDTQFHDLQVSEPVDHWGAKHLYTTAESHSDQLKQMPYQSDFSAPLSASLDAAHSRPDSCPPAAFGGYLEPYFHFWTSTSPKELSAHLNGALERLRSQPDLCGSLDFMQKENNFNFECEVHVHGESVPFVVRVFRSETDASRHAVEFQRRKGDAMLFCKVYRQCLQYLGELGVDLGEEAEQQEHPLNGSPPFAPITFTPLDLPVPKQEEIAEGVRCLLGMVNSEYVDVSAEGLRGLVPMTEDTNMQQTLLDLGVVDALVDRISIEFEDIHRCALTALANLAESAPADVCQSVVRPGVLPVLVERSRSRTVHVVRETVRLLTGLSSKVNKFEGLNDFMKQVGKAVNALDTRGSDVKQCWDTLAARWAAAV